MPQPKLYLIEFEGAHYSWSLVTTDRFEGIASMAQALHDWCVSNPHADPAYFGLDGAAMAPDDLVEWALDYLIVFEYDGLNVVEMH